MKKQLHLLLFVFYCLIVQTTNAQVSSIPYAAALDNFTVISGTTIDAPFADDVFYSHIPIGFSFDYAGSSHTEMVVSCNGYIQLDTLPNSQFVNVLNLF